MFARSLFFLRQALVALSRSIGITFLSMVTIALALAILAIFGVVVENLARLADTLSRDVHLSAYLRPATPRAEVEAASREVASWAHVAGVRVVTAPEALEDFKRALGQDAVLLDGLPPDVLPPSLEIRLEPREWTRGEVQAIAEATRRIASVEEVRFGQEDIEQVFSLLALARIASLVLGAALCLATILIISNTIRMTVYARRDEIEIMSLVGATNAFVRAPFVLEGAIQGLLGGGFAFVLLLSLENALVVGLERGFSYAYGPVDVTFVPSEAGVYLVVAGASLGLIGSGFAVGRFLKV